jgi:D-glycero-alpha-D-manno-heptose-7-phosphate kinase
MQIETKAPCRVDLAGGTLDIWPLYLFHQPSLTLNFAVTLYATCRLEELSDGAISIVSRDQKCGETFRSLEDLAGRKRYRLPLPAMLVKYFRPSGGLRLELECQAPRGAGIAGSSTLNIAICAALNRLTGREHTLEQLREIAQNVEAQVIRVPTGCQDYYPAMYGAVNAIHLTPGGIVREPLRVDVAELEERVVLIYTGEPRESGINNWQVMKKHLDGDRQVHRNFQQIASVAVRMCHALQNGRWDEVGKLLAREWANRKRNYPGITTAEIDRLVEAALRKGAVAAKACGAGGGGCVLLFVRKGTKAAVEEETSRQGGKVLPVRVAPAGVEVWGA